MDNYLSLSNWETFTIIVWIIQILIAIGGVFGFVVSLAISVGNYSIGNKHEMVSKKSGTQFLFISFYVIYPIVVQDIEHKFRLLNIDNILTTLYLLGLLLYVYIIYRHIKFIRDFI